MNCELNGWEFYLLFIIFFYTHVITKRCARKCVAAVDLVRVFIFWCDESAGGDVSRQPRRPNGAFWVQPKMAAPLPKCWRSASPEKLSGLRVVSADAVAPGRPLGSPVCRGTPRDAARRKVLPSLRVAVADCPCEDGPRLQPLPIAKSRGERSRRFPCKHAPVQLGFDGFDILYRLWTLPYNFLTRIVCATVSAIVRRRRASSARVDNPTAPRSARICTLRSTAASSSSNSSSSAISLHVRSVSLLCLLGLFRKKSYFLNDARLSRSLTAGRTGREPAKRQRAVTLAALV